MNEMVSHAIFSELTGFPRLLSLFVYLSFSTSLTASLKGLDSRTIAFFQHTRRYRVGRATAERDVSFTSLAI